MHDSLYAWLVGEFTKDSNPGPTMIRQFMSDYWRKCHEIISRTNQISPASSSRLQTRQVTTYKSGGIHSDSDMLAFDLDVWPFSCEITRFIKVSKDNILLNMAKFLFVSNGALCVWVWCGIVIFWSKWYRELRMLWICKAKFKLFTYYDLSFSWAHWDIVNIATLTFDL